MTLFWPPFFNFHSQYGQWEGLFLAVLFLTSIPVYSFLSVSNFLINFVVLAFSFFFFVALVVVVLTSYLSSRDQANNLPRDKPQDAFLCIPVTKTPSCRYVKTRI